MTDGIAKRLVELGYRTDADYMLSHLPSNIWVTISDKNIKHREVNFILTKTDQGWTFTLSAPSDSYGEVYVLHRTKDESATTAIAQMILFLEDNKMLQPTV